MRSFLIVSLCVLLLLPSVIHPPRAHAILPALAAGAATALEGTIVEAVGAAGLRWGAKQISQKVAPRVVGYLAKKGVDLNFLGKKPRRIARDLAEIELDAEDQAKLVDASVLLKRESTEIQSKRTKNWEKPQYSYIGDNPDPYKNTSLTLIQASGMSDESKAFLSSFFDVIFEPVPYQGKAKVALRGTYSQMTSSFVQIDSTKYPTAYIYLNFNGYSTSYMNFTLFGSDAEAKWGAYGLGYTYIDNFNAEVSAWQAYKLYLARAGTKVIYADGLYFPKNIDDVYVRPDGSDAQYPSIPKIEPKKIQIKVPDGEIGTDVEWDTKIDIDNHYNKYIFNYNTDIDITYDIDYTDIENPTKNEDFEKPPIKPGTGTGSGECCTEAFFPDQALYEAYKLSLYTALMAKMPIVEQLDKISARFRKEGDSTGTWEGVYINDATFGRVPVIDPTWFNANKDSIQLYFKVGIWVMVLIFSYRKISEILSR